MAGVERLPGRDPQCACPEVTFRGGPPAEVVAACREASRGRLHRVLTGGELAELSAAFRAGYDDPH